MRIQLSPEQALGTGKKLAEVNRRFLQQGIDDSLTHERAEQILRTFHFTSPQGQLEEFSGPVWEIFSEYASVVAANLTKLAPLEKKSSSKYPIVPGFKEAIDLVLEIVNGKDGITIPAINIDKGGLASNSVEALRMQGIPTVFPALLGNVAKPITKLHTELMQASGIDTSNAVHTTNPAYLHTDYYLESDSRKDEYWMAQHRIPFIQSELDEFLNAIRTACKQNSGQALVLSALPPAGSGEHYFTDIAQIGHENGNPVLFNPKQFDYLDPKMGSFLGQLFLQKKLNVIKPNLVEFVQFLKYSFIITPHEEENLLKELRKDVEEDRFDRLVKLSKKLLNCLDPDNGILIVSIGSKGAFVINKKYAIHSTAPTIGNSGCPSGAGDTGLASIIGETRKQKREINLLEPLDDGKLIRLLTEFIYGASATASLPGNKIATPEVIDSFRSQDLTIQSL